MLRETLKQFVQYNAMSLGLIPDLVTALTCEEPVSHNLQNCIFSTQLCNEFGRDESRGMSSSRGRAENETPEGIRRAETKSLRRPI